VDKCEPLARGADAAGGPAGKAAGGPRHGRAMQVDPIKTTLKPTGIKRLKLMCATLLSTSGFKLNLRRHTTGRMLVMGRALHSSTFRLNQGLTLVHFSVQFKRFLRDRGYI